MKSPGFKLKKSTRATLAGIIIAISSLYALTVAYDIPVTTLAGYLLGSLLLVLATCVVAVAVVMLINLLRRTLKRIMSADD